MLTREHPLPPPLKVPHKMEGHRSPAGTPADPPPPFSGRHIAVAVPYTPPRGAPRRPATHAAGAPAGLASAPARRPPRGADLSADQRGSAIASAAATSAAKAAGWPQITTPTRPKRHPVPADRRTSATATAPAPGSARGGLVSFVDGCASVRLRVTPPHAARSSGSAAGRANARPSKTYCYSDPCATREPRSLSARVRRLIACASSAKPTGYQRRTL